MTLRYRGLRLDNLHIAEMCRDVRGLRWLDDFLMDLRYAARTLWRNPGFLSAAVLSLALGIGANAAIFSLIEAVMLRAMPVPEAQRLVQFSKQYADGSRGSLSYPLFEYLQDGSHAFSGILHRAMALIGSRLVSGVPPIR